MRAGGVATGGNGQEEPSRGVSFLSFSSFLLAAVSPARGPLGFSLGFLQISF